MKRKPIIFAFVIVFLIAGIAHSKAQNFAIVAIVNGEVISNFTLHDRVTLIISSSGLQNTPEMRSRLTSQALQILINEKLQKQDAKKMGVAATENDLKRAITDLEVKNNLKKGEFDSFIASQGISKDSLLEQIKAQILWKKVVSRRIHPKVVVSDYEINDTQNWISSKKVKEEVYMSEILIPINDDKSEEEAKALAEKLVEEIRTGNAKFGKVAEQFSASNTASKGGAVGWVPVSQADNKILQEKLENAKAHEILDPIKTDKGFHIIKVGNRRNNNPSTTTEKVREMLFLQKIDLESKSYMKNLRKNSFIEIRL